MQIKRNSRSSRPIKRLSNCSKHIIRTKHRHIDFLAVPTFKRLQIDTDYFAEGLDATFL